MASIRSYVYVAADETTSSASHFNYGCILEWNLYGISEHFACDVHYFRLPHLDDPHRKPRGMQLLGAYALL